MSVRLPASLRCLALATLPLLLPTAAEAASATASQAVNVRSGPATTYDVVAKLQAGDSVDVRQCEGSFCQVSFGGKTGWVSATYLTRDYVAKAPATTTVATTGAAKSTDLPPIVGSSPAPRVATSTATSDDLPPVGGSQPTTAPQVASAAPPSGHSNLALPPGTFPPAYDDESGAADFSNGSDGPYADVETPDSPRSSVTFSGTDDDGDVVASTDDPNVPRPKADIPNGAFTGPKDDASSDDNSGDFANNADDGDFVGPDPTDEDRFGQGTGWRGRFADRSGWHGRFGRTRGGEACFFSGSGFGGDGFCLRPGQTVADLGPWADRVFVLRNPRGLLVTVCSGEHDCHVYDSTGPLLPGRAGIASISVAAPGY